MEFECNASDLKHEWHCVGCCCCQSERQIQSFPAKYQPGVSGEIVMQEDGHQGFDGDCSLIEPLCPSPCQSFMHTPAKAHVIHLAVHGNECGQLCCTNRNSI